MFSLCKSFGGLHKSATRTPAPIRSFFQCHVAHKPWAAFYRKLRQNPEAYQAYLDKQSQRRMKSRSGTDGFKCRQKKRDLNKEYTENHPLDERESFARLLRSWICSNSWVRDELPWKSHRPVLYDKPIKQECVRCGRTRRNGQRLWWESSGDDGPVCFHCYALKQDLNQVMPKGYEDVRTMPDLRRRKVELDVLRGEATKDYRADMIEATKANLRNWSARYPWFSQLPWKSHRPLTLAKTADYQCYSCKNWRALRCWWQALGEPDNHLCFTCYMQQDWSEIMPRGYEDVTTAKELRQRKDQLEEEAHK